MPNEQPEMEGLDDMGVGMGEQEPMEEPNQQDLADGGSELENVFSQLDTEKQAAVLKYAKSMVENVEHEDLVNEIENEIMADRKKPKKESINKEVNLGSNPFVTKY
jgi:hypothetical protein